MTERTPFKIRKMNRQLHWRGELIKDFWNCHISSRHSKTLRFWELDELESKMCDVRFTTLLKWRTRQISWSWTLPWRTSSSYWWVWSRTLSPLQSLCLGLCPGHCQWLHPHVLALRAHLVQDRPVHHLRHRLRLHLHPRPYGRGQVNTLISEKL